MKENNEKTSNDESDRITTWGYASFLVTLTKSGFLGMASYILFKYSSINAYISAILGTIIGFIPLFLFIFIEKNSDTKDILELNTSNLGKIVGTILNIVLNISFLLMAVMALYNISQFIDIQYMADTNSNYLRILLLVAIAYAASKNISVISRVSQIMVGINIVMFLLSMLGSIGSIKIDNIFPIMKDGFSPILYSSLIYTLFSTFPIFLLTIIPQNHVMQEKYKTRKLLLMYLLGNIMLICIIIVTVTVLGEDLITIFKYPEYIALKKVELFGLLERIENTLALQFVFNSIMFLIMSFHFMIKSLKKIFKYTQRENLFPYLISILVLVLSNIFFKNTIQATNFITNYVPYIILIGIFIPMLITFFGIIMKKTKHSTL